MADNIQRSRGRGQGYQFGRGGMPTEFGPFVGEIRNNIDPTRSGRVQVYIEQFAGINPNDATLWRTVSYMTPFYGSTPGEAPPQGSGTFRTNPQSYGMWFTPPDIGVRVICFFCGGDPNQGFYIGCLPEDGINHMIPAVGATGKFIPEPGNPYFSKSSQLPVTEINNESTKTAEDPRFFNAPKPVHSYVAAVMVQQGLINDVIRGPITSSSQRESPSSVYGISTPGRPIYQGGLTDVQIQAQLEAGQVKPENLTVVGRRGGHSIVMDDGNLNGYDNLVRIRTSKGHQITMSDDGDCFYITHANGQSWIELGSEGTVDVFSTNSVNVRTQGELNFHADQDINMYAGQNINMKSKAIKLTASSTMDLVAKLKLALDATGTISISATGALALSNTGLGGWNSTGPLSLKGAVIGLNTFPGVPALSATEVADTQLPNVKFVANQGWTVEQSALKSCVSRAPTHEPYPYHNRGVSIRPIDLGGSGSTTQGAVTDAAADVVVPLPPDTSILDMGGGGG